jgi:hypothetical protein
VKDNVGKLSVTGRTGGKLGTNLDESVVADESRVVSHLGLRRLPTIHGRQMKLLLLSSSAMPILAANQNSRSPALPPNIIVARVELAVLCQRKWWTPGVVRYDFDYCCVFDEEPKALRDQTFHRSQERQL